jgi:hypothetical protein
MISAAASNYNYQQPSQQQRNISMPPLSSARVTSHVPTFTNNNNKSSSYGSSGGIGNSGGTLSAPTVPQEGLRDIVKRRLFEDIFKDCMGMYKNVLLIVRRSIIALKQKKSLTSFDCLFDVTLVSFNLDIGHMNIYIYIHVYICIQSIQK